MATDKNTSPTALGPEAKAALDDAKVRSTEHLAKTQEQIQEGGTSGQGETQGG